MEKDPDITNPRYNENIFPSPMAIRYIRVPLYRAEEYGLLYRGVQYRGVCYIGVSL